VNTPDPSHPSPALPSLPTGSRPLMPSCTVTYNKVRACRNPGSDSQTHSQGLLAARGTCSAQLLNLVQLYS
jgi:hypothetical protein